MGMIRDIEEMLDDMLFEVDGLDYVNIKRGADIYDIEQLYYLLGYPDEERQTEALLDLLKEKAERSKPEFLEFLHTIFEFDELNELLEALKPGPIKQLIASALAEVQPLEPGTLVTRDRGNGAVVYRVKEGYTCRSLVGDARAEIFAPAWSGPCPPNYDRLELHALIYANGEWWQVEGDLRRKTQSFENVERFVLPVRRIRHMHRTLCNDYLVDPNIEDVIGVSRLMGYELTLMKRKEVNDE